jgi:Flp pilus assembly protein TadD
MNRCLKTTVVICLLLQIFTNTLFAQVEKDLSAGQTWAVIVGISRYKNIQNLNYADKDAKAFYNYLVNADAGPKLNTLHVKLLLNEEALSSEVYGAMDWLKESVKENDRVIFYFSGHADVERKTAEQDGFLLAYNSPVAAYMTTGTISIKYLNQYLKAYVDSNRAKDVILIVDACHSGKLAGGIEGVQLTRQALEQSQYKRITKILSAQENEFSFEGTRWGGGRGVFSYYLIKGLEGLADRNRDNMISNAELAAYLYYSVANATGNAQHPELDGDADSELFSFDRNPPALNTTGEGNSPGVRTGLGTGIADDLAPDVQTEYKQYLDYLNRGRMICGNDQQDTINCAKAIYKQLINKPGAESLHASLKSSFIAALQWKTQELLNDYIKQKPIIFKAQYETYKEISYAKQLVSPNYILYNYISARAYFLAQYFGPQVSSMGPLIKKSLQYEPDTPYALNDLGNYYISLGEIDSAIYCMKEAIAAAPNWAFAYTTLGIAYSERKDNAKAIWCFNKSIRLNRSGAFQGRAIPYGNMGALYARLKEYKKAILYYKKAVILDPSQSQFLEGLGACYMYTKDFRNCTRYMKKAIDLSPDGFDYYYNLACAFSLQNNCMTGVRYLKQAINKGFKDYDQIMRDDDLRNLRKTAGFKKLMKQYIPDKAK